MAIRKGDRVTIGIAPSIQLAQYSYVKPSASVTREIVSNDETGIKVELEGIMDDLKRLIVRATLTELGLSSDLHAAVAEGENGLAQFCMKELHYEPTPSDFRAPGKGDPAAAERPRTKALPAVPTGIGGPLRKGPVRRQ